MHTVTDALTWVQGLQSVGYKPGNKRMLWMLECVGNPERRLKFIHIAGTNGKGSNVAFLSSVLRSSGYMVGAYISPHVTTYLSRITVNGVDINEQALLEICQLLKPIVDELTATELGSPSEFEVFTMIAIIYFARYAVPDIVLWETGLGGRTDSTNVVHPVLTIITNVTYDHTKMLGDTLEEIAWDKAGIIKGGVPVITAVEDEGAYQVIEEIAKKHRAKVYRLGKEFHMHDTEISSQTQKFCFQGPFRNYDGLELGLKGIHQFNNAATSLMTLELLRQFYAFLIDEENVIEGYRNATHPGRLEVVDKDPLIVYDGAHNVDGAKMLAQSIPQLFNYEQLTLVTSIMQDKAIDDMLEHLLPLAQQVVITKADNERAAAPDMIKEKIINKNPHLPIYIVEEPIEAVKKAMMLSKKSDMILIAGSLYLIESLRFELLKLTELRVGVE